MASDAEDRALNELVQRLLIQPYPDAPTSVELHPGRLPDNLSIDLPILPSARLVGSAVYRRDGAILKVEAVVDVPTPGAAAERAYEEHLRLNGWGVFGQFGGGFSSTASGIPRSFRHDRKGPTLVLNAIDRGKQGTNFRLYLHWEMPQTMRHLPHDGMDRIPSLLAPPGVPVEGGGGGGGGSHWSSRATAYTDMAVPELQAYLAEQLVLAGWTRLGGDSDNVVAWSSWKVPGPGDWVGLLLVTAFERRERSLLVHLQAPTRRHSGRHSSVALSRPMPWRRRFSLRRPF